MTVNGRRWDPNYKTIETLECGHQETHVGWYHQDRQTGALVTKGYEQPSRRRCHDCAVERFEAEARWAAENGLPRP